MSCEEKSVKADGSGEHRRQCFETISRQNADCQAKLAVMLLALIPALACFYMGGIVAYQGDDSFPMIALIVVVVCTFVISASGYVILRKYTAGIIKVRKYVAEIARGSLPRSITLDASGNSSDLQCIEENLNLILKAMAKRMRLIEEKLKVEAGLRHALEQQQQVILNVERHRVMLQSIGAACHHLGQPATALRMRLYLMREKAHSVDELDEIEESLRDVEAICEVLNKLREVDEYRTEPYLASSDSDGSQILAI